MTIERKLKDLRNCLHNIMELPAANQRATINQCIRLEDRDLELLQNSTANVVIIQAAQINAQMIAESSKALQHLNTLEGELKDLEITEESINKLIDKMVLTGWTWQRIKRVMLKRCVSRALKLSDTKAAAAKMLGIKRTTFLQNLKRIGYE